MIQAKLRENAVGGSTLPQISRSSERPKTPEDDRLVS